MPWLRKAYWLLTQQFGIDPRRLVRAPIGFMRYVRDLARFWPGNSYALRLQPCLHDWWEEAGAVRSEYFWQDLFVARMIHDAAPRRHVDVGSRLDGFVAHVASFRPIEVLDIRPLQLTIPGVTFRQADLMQMEGLPERVTDSLSCLHAIEHFGLGRYGDPVNADGVGLGLRALVRLLEPGGRLYLSCPAGPDVVEFNAHRRLRPGTLVGLAGQAGLQLEACWLFDTGLHKFERQDGDVTTVEPTRTQTLAVYAFLRAQ